MKSKFCVLAALAFACGFGFMVANVQPAAAQAAVAKTVLDDTLNGGIFEQTMIQIVEIPKGGVVPLHIHPDGHEITYVMDGELVLEVDGQPTKTYKGGDAFHVQPNVPHTGHSDTGAKLVVVRLKGKDKPIATPVKR